MYALKNKELITEYNIFCKNVKYYRNLKKMTQEALAEEADLSISYIKTKNVYVPMTAHFIGNLFGNGIDIIITIIAMISN